MKRGLFNKGDKGASLIEAAFVLPLLIGLAIGISEVGFLVIDYLTVSNSAREGARTGAAAADYDEGGTDADDLILESVEEAACNLKFGHLKSVSIFKANTDGEPTGDLMEINTYDAPGGLVCGLGNGIECNNGCPWKPEDREREEPYDVLGVEVVFTHSSVTGLFPFPTVDWSETAVMQIEPDTSVSP